MVSSIVNKSTMCRCGITVFAWFVVASTVGCNEAFAESVINGNIVQYLQRSGFNQQSDNWIYVENEPAAEKPVNERFPSAVLFGRTCGGTIISSKWILSAAHCLIGENAGIHGISTVPSTLFTGGREVLAGTNNSLDGSGVKRRVKRLVVHPRFSVGPYWLDPARFNIKQVGARFDFLLAELEEPLPLDQKTMVAANLDGPKELPPGVNVGYAGYGAKNHGETMRHDMHAMALVTLPDDKCSRLTEYDKQDMLCAQGRPPNFDSGCNGDSGSGLVTDDNTLVGVTSWVENDAIECKNGNIVVFSRVAAVRSWIKEVAGV